MKPQRPRWNPALVWGGWGFQGRCWLGCVFLRGGEAWRRRVKFSWELISGLGTQKQFRAGGFAGTHLCSVLSPHPSSSSCFSQTYFCSSFKNLACHTGLIIRSLFLFPDSIWLFFFFFSCWKLSHRRFSLIPRPWQPAWGIKLKK